MSPRISEIVSPDMASVSLPTFVPRRKALDDRHRLRPQAWSNLDGAKRGLPQGPEGAGAPERGRRSGVAGVPRQHRGEGLRAGSAPPDGLLPARSPALRAYVSGELS